MSLSSNLRPARPAGRAGRATGARRDEPALLLADGVLEELYRRRNALAFALVMGLFLLAAAVGQRVLAEQGHLGARTDGPALTASSSSSELQGGPTGTWQRWGDLGSEKRSQASLTPSSRSSTTTFAASNASANTTPVTGQGPAGESSAVTTIP